MRRLLGLDVRRQPDSFFVDLHEILVFATGTHIPWKDSERRRAVVDFAEDVERWRAEFGDPVVLSTSAADWKKTRAALEWLGIRVKGDARTYTMDRRDDTRSLRRQACLEALGFPISSLLARLQHGERVEIAAGNATAPLPFGLAAWRDTLEEPGLSAANAFLSFVKNVRASRMLVALHGIDAETRDELRDTIRDARGHGLGWRILYNQVLDAFGRYPEALMMRDGRFVLPGGKEAEAVWTDIVGVSPSDRVAFLPALYQADSGKAAYVAAVLQQLPDALARELLLGRTAGGEGAVKRFRRLYRSIDAGGVNYGLVLRDPYDFAHLARFLKLSDDGNLLLPPATFEESSFPRNPAELEAALVRASKTVPPEEYLRRLLRNDSPGSAIRFPAQRRFLFVSSLLEKRPDLADPGLLLLLASGLDRFWAAYAVLEDLPLDAALAREYLFALDRLDRRSASREAEVAAGLFQGAVELLAEIARARTLPPEEIRRLAALLLRLPLFAKEGITPAEGEAALYDWLSEGLLSSLRSAQSRAITARPPETGTAEPVASSDELLAQAASGWGGSVSFEWRGGRYRFDPCADDAARRRQFRDTQRLVWISGLETLHARRAALVSAAARGDVAGARAAVAELSKEMGLPAGDRPKNDRDPDAQLAKELAHARGAATELSRISKPKQLAKVGEEIGRFDAVIAERHLEAYLGHVYAAYAQPEDLYYQDPGFVRRHSFHPPGTSGKLAGSAFARTALVDQRDGGGSRVTGSLFGVADTLGLLHADQVPRKPGASIGSEEVRSGLVAGIDRMSPSLLDDDALTVLAASCRAAEELVAALASVPARERARLWSDLARDIVPRSRLSVIASLEELAGPEDIARELAPSDLYLIGRRLAAGRVPPGLPLVASAARAREALERLRSRGGETGARDRLAQFGPRAVFYAGRFSLTDLELPPYERFADYRTPQLLSDRLYDLKISVARRVSDAGLPAAVLPIVVPGALDEMLGSLKMAFAYNWAAVVRASQEFSAADVDRLLDAALRSGRLVRDQSADEAEEAAK